ncbi:hypothetical protein H4R21_002945 [Coemansia helicoidea]|uniref:Uncharacterized protein n=1 Tax=Coemansia helicoidea TaxID=1286919 RepID=A0ACC1L430_9FUNG|nr:hypothetical protein H4R21_002945 [Coemansia helicoidea]
MDSIVDFLVLAQRGAGVLWVDTHERPMANNRKPDGLLVVGAAAGQPQWHDAVAAFEVKSDRVGGGDGALVGQLLRNFRDMAEDQPRRRSIGFTVFKSGQVHMYLCLPSVVLQAEVGPLPGATIEGDHHRLVRVLLMTLLVLPSDLGFVVNKVGGISAPFGRRDIPGYMDRSATQLANDAVSIQDSVAIGGRRRNIVGPRSWLFHATASLADEQAGGYFQAYNCVVKYHLYMGGRSEAAVHAQAVDMGLPHVPGLLGSAEVAQQGGSLRGEILLIERCAMDIGKFYTAMRHDAATSHVAAYVMLDLFAGYAHTILAAAIGSRNVQIMHRDVSMGNLMVKDDNSPAVIDWGCGVVIPFGELRAPVSSPMVGTAPYMGLRVLLRMPQRSVVDDLESLFLVLTHCLVQNHTSGRDPTVGVALEQMWSGKLNLEAMVDIRKKWLGSEDSYWDWLMLRDCPQALEVLAKSLHRLLFLGDVSMAMITGSHRDPRLDRISLQRWAGAFVSAANVARRSGPVHLPCLQRLAAYIRTQLEGGIRGRS